MALQGDVSSLSSIKFGPATQPWLKNTEIKQRRVGLSQPGLQRMEDGAILITSFTTLRSHPFSIRHQRITRFVQYGGSEQDGEILGSRQRFETNLRNRQGLSYVVAHDPLEPAKQIEAPDGTKHPANVWVIRKQYRAIAGDDSSIEVLAYYYISNDVIYEAPTIAKVLSNRMLNISDSISKIFSEALQHPLFSVSHGHTYMKPVQKTISQKEPGAAQQSKESTPMPGQEGPEADKPSAAPGVEKVQKNADSRTLFQALQMTMRYGKEYSDEVPLAGEPGNFRFSKKPDRAPTSSGVVQVAASQTSGSRAGTPAQSRAASIVPAAK